MLIFGIDCATKDNNIGYSIYDINANNFITVNSQGDKQTAIISDIKRFIDKHKILLCFDSPLGWPSSFAKNLIKHNAGEYININQDEFFRRETDVLCEYLLGKRLYEVSADKIARTTFKTLQMINTIKSTYSNLQMLWSCNQSFELGYIEVYPRSWLISEFEPSNISIEKYKGSAKENKLIRRTLITEIQKKGINLSTIQQQMIDSEHIFDSVLCCLNGLDFINNRCLDPSLIIDKAKKEGWIWFKPVI